MLCSNCGVEVGNDLPHCPHCGRATPSQPASSDQVLSNTPPPQVGPDVSAPPKRPWQYNTFFIVVILFLLAPAGIALTWMQSPRAPFLGETPTRIMITLFFGYLWLKSIFPIELHCMVRTIKSLQ